MFQQPPPLSLYIHIPWCLKKCPYCDFNSYVRMADSRLESAYQQALLADLVQELPHIQNRPIETVFIGGGTPSLFSSHCLGTLLEKLHIILTIPAGAEITLEANPETLNQQRLREFLDLGINRLSLGIQSFDESSLKKLGRIHSRDTALTMAQTALATGFTHVNLDLMFGLPDQTISMALQDLAIAVALHPQHLSWYQLTLEPQTVFGKHPPTLPDEETLWTLQTEGQAYLASQGYEHYEISAYAQPQAHCRHNLNYWQFGDYLGIGAGAHGKLTQLAQPQITRSYKQSHPERYLHTAHSADVKITEPPLSESQIILEFMINALRLTQGFYRSQFEQRTGIDLNQLTLPLTQAIAHNWLIKDHDHIYPTPLGLRYLNNLLELFV